MKYQITIGRKWSDGNYGTYNIEETVFGDEGQSHEAVMEEVFRNLIQLKREVLDPKLEGQPLLSGSPLPQ